MYENAELMESQEARLEAYKHLVAAETILSFTGDDSLLGEIEDTRTELGDRIDTDI